MQSEGIVQDKINLQEEFMRCAMLLACNEVSALKASVEDELNINLSVGLAIMLMLGENENEDVIYLLRRLLLRE